MTIILDIQNILNVIPVFLEYLVPGFVLIIVFTYMTSKKTPDYIIAESIGISYILKSLCSCLHQIFFKGIIFPWYVRAIILCALALVVAIILIFAVESNVFKSLCLRIGNKTLHDDVWPDVIDYKRGTTLRMICDDVTYIGVLAYHEERGNDSWFVLDKYIIEENNQTYKAENVGYDSRIAINIRDVKRVELYYGK